MRLFKVLPLRTPTEAARLIARGNSHLSIVAPNLTVVTNAYPEALSIEVVCDVVVLMQQETP